MLLSHLVHVKADREPCLQYKITQYQTVNLVSSLKLPAHSFSDILPDLVNYLI